MNFDREGLKYLCLDENLVPKWLHMQTVLEKMFISAKTGKYYSKQERVYNLDNQDHNQDPAQENLAGKSCRKFLREILAGNSCGKFLQEILVGKSCGKFLQEILAGNSCGNFLWEILAGNSCGKFLQENLAGKSCRKFLREILAGNSCRKYCGQSGGKFLQEILWKKF